MDFLIDEKASESFFQKARLVYNYLQDTTSRQLFVLRMEHSITGSFDSLKKIVECKKNSNDTFTVTTRNYSTICPISDESIVLYGAGKAGRAMLRELKSKYPDCHYIFCDKKWRETQIIDGVMVVGLEEIIAKYKYCKIVITSVDFVKEIAEDLMNSGISFNNVFSVVPCIFLRKGNLDINEYFDKDIIQFTSNEVFVDGGAYDAQTTLEFIKRCNSYKKIHVFEPSIKMKNKIDKNIKEHRDVETHFIGLWKERDTLFFSSALDTGSKIAESQSSEVIEVDSIDNICSNESVTFIKLDIEGSELDALQGAKNTIKQHKPKLAICVYHKPQDIIDIPLYLKSLVPEYKLYLRHYGAGQYETVLYATL